MPPKVIVKPDRGVLPVDASARAPKSPAVKLKLEIRRLPPGLTLTEFEDILGNEWTLGKGKIDWREYRQGKIKSPGKLPEQSRCYIHLKSEPLISEFEARFLSIVFHDKAGTHRLPELKHLPPTLGFALNQRTPLHTKQRTDNRQGTIDQDPEFIAFLEAETQPIVKPAAVENTVDRDKEDVKSTPLIDDLRERKANKAKAAATKAEREKEKQKAKSKPKEKDKEVEQAKEKEKEVEKDAKGPRESKLGNSKSERPVKQGPKSIAKQPAKVGIQASVQTDQKVSAPDGPAKNNVRGTREKRPQPTPATSTTTSPNPPTGPANNTTTTLASRPRQRGNNLEGIKKQLHKDLGVKINPTPSASSASEKTSNKPPTQPSSQTATIVNAPSVAARPGSKATIATASNKTQAQNKSAPSPAAAPAVPSTKAYLKHANPSQGMTEILIQQALSTYGNMVNVTIDPRKGTAIAIFADSEGLQKAIAAKRVTVANGAVEVLEFKDRSAGPSTAGPSTTGASGGGTSAGGVGRQGVRGNRVGRGGNRMAKDGPVTVSSNANANAGSRQSSAKSATAPAAATAANTQPAATPSPSTAPVASPPAPSTA